MSRTIFNTIELLPPDALFGIKQRYNADERKDKVDLGIGAYRDNQGKPWVLPSVKSAELAIHADPNYNHEYLNITGLNALTSGAANIIFGPDSDAIKNERIVSTQSISGTGALHIAAKFLSKFFPERKIYLSDPTWANHQAIFQAQGLVTNTYPYWDNETKSLDLNGFERSIEVAPEGSVFVLHACAHNPTGLDPTKEQWETILERIAYKGHLALFDSAYQGFASGDLNKDAYSIRLGVEKLKRVAPILVCQSFAKNVGMYGERVGCFHIVLPEQDTKEELTTVKKALSSQLSKIIRSEVSNPPAYGAKIVATILNSDELRAQWYKDMITMSSRIMEMRVTLRDRLNELGTPGTWDHIVEQTGMFSFTGLTSEMVARLEKEHSIYMVSSGRASIAGLNKLNVDRVAQSIDEVVRHFTNESKL
ncbi:hypothetical protein NCAS_0A04170 [Naumovozyma castellii]|uniref:Aspartate aminotransferase n=1 Tax=Naumovozyma castellii TaxID=27288 RepID=G0V683_NAUCA|nr:hypothetical protein NCAS_0A04170 [Naumovozyma castellii CBS 4309]CCC66975.1 hypothetical protein NCAS_0A04170 [Naumovozyma castellii CBS 4309]